ncbi:MAG: hypothetical protein OHK0048_13200 [Rhodoferax sp.]
MEKEASSAALISTRGFLFALVCGLVGCAARSPAPAPALQYDLGPLPDWPGRSTAGPVLELSVRAGVPVLATAAMLFRLIYVQAQQVQPYALARWSQPPVVLLGQRLRHQLAQRFTVVTPGEVLLSPAPPTPPSGSDPALPKTQPTPQNFGLRVTLEEFSQVFASRELSSALVRVRATLVRHDERGADVLLAQHTLAAQHPAASADAAGGALALAAATARLVQDLDDWVAQVLAHVAV